jgi:maltose-binding protein MalE
MKKALVFVGILALGLAMALPALASTAPTAGTWTGWISDSHCAEKGANAKHTQACVEKCTKDGGKVVFFNNADKKLYNLDEAGAKLALDHVGHEVTVSGAVADGTITVEKIEAAKTQ